MIGMSYLLPFVLKMGVGVRHSDDGRQTERPQDPHIMSYPYVIPFSRVWAGPVTCF